MFRAIAAGTTQISVWQALQKERSWQHARKNRLIRIAAIKAEVLDRKLRASAHLEDDSEDDEAMDSGVWRKNYRLEEVEKHPPGTWRCTWCRNANAPSTTDCTYYYHKSKKRCEGSQAKSWGGYVEPPTSKYAYNPPSHAFHAGRRRAEGAKARQRRALTDRKAQASKDAAQAGGWKCDRCAERGREQINMAWREKCQKCSFPRAFQEAPDPVSYTHLTLPTILLV